MAANEIYAQIKDSLDIADIIGERVKLRKSSRGYSGLCPFHEERTPSFHVYTDTQSYYCFSCHEAGDIFTYTMKTEGIEFRNALEVLADRAGIELPKYDRESGGKNPIEIVKLTAKFYTDNLLQLARKYLERRKLDDSDITRFSLGYAPNSWDALVNYLRKLKITDKQLLDLGLALQGKHGLYDRFRGRIIFPIKDIAGRIIAFGGRLIDGEGAKYINSPESEIYKKRKNLYLLDRAKSAIREKKRSILVEGYMDAIRLHKCGFIETVASLGTSLTPEQAETLSRFADRCYICYDSDNAGRNAMLRSMFVLQKHGLDVYVVNISGSKDPDEFLSENPPSAFEDLLTKARPLVAQYTESLSGAVSDPLTRKSAMTELFTTLSELEVYEVLQHKTYLSEVTGVPPSKIEDWFTSHNKRAIPKAETPAPIASVKGVEHPSESALCSLLFRHAECRLSIEPQMVMRLLRNPTARDIALATLTENTDDLLLLWTTLNETERLAVLARGDELCARMKGLSLAEKWHSTLRALQERYINRRVRELTSKLQKSQATPEELSELQRLKRENHR